MNQITQKLENKMNHLNALGSLCISFITTILAWTIYDLETHLRIGATIVGLVSGILAARYYWHSGNKVKNDRFSNNRKNKRHTS